MNTSMLTQPHTTTTHAVARVHSAACHRSPGHRQLPRRPSPPQRMPRPPQVWPFQTRRGPVHDPRQPTHAAHTPTSELRAPRATSTDGDRIPSTGGDLAGLLSPVRQAPYAGGDTPLPAGAHTKHGVRRCACQRRRGDQVGSPQRTIISRSFTKRLRSSTKATVSADAGCTFRPLASPIVGLTRRAGQRVSQAGEGAVTPRASLGTRHTPGEDLRVQQLVLLANHVLRRGQVVLQRANL